MRMDTVLGCGGAIHLRCKGGCLEIKKILFSCTGQEEGNKRQLKQAKKQCDKKEKCTLQASRKLFGSAECPDTPDSEMKMWIVYGCHGGKLDTKITGPNMCKGNWGCQ